MNAPGSAVRRGSERGAVERERDAGEERLNRRPRVTGGVNRTVAALLAVLAVLALGAAAATLEDTTAAGGAGGTGDERGVGAGTGDRFDLGGLNESEVSEAATLPPIVGKVFAVILVSVAAFGIYVFYREHGLRGLLTVLGAVGVFVLLLYLLLQGVGSGVDLDGRSGLLDGQSPTIPGGAPAGPESNVVPVIDPPATLLALFGLVLVGAAALVLRLTGDDVAEAAPEMENTPAPDVAAVGLAAGRAADRIEADVGVENAVFRAWREMTRELDVDNPTASTPAEFAAAAVDAGMAREDVTELTGLFEAVRYGGHDPDADRERRAVDALRNIQRTYADAEFDVPEATDGGSGVRTDPADRTDPTDSADSANGDGRRATTDGAGGDAA